MTNVNQATGADLREFLRQAVKRGELNPSTGNAQRVAVSKVLASEEDPEGVDIRSLDLARVLERFESQNRTGYSRASLATYKTRFRNAVSMYLAWLDGDPTWKNVMRPRRTDGQSVPRMDTSVKTVDRVVNVREYAQGDRASRSRATATPVVTYQLPLRPDLLVQLELPVDLTPADADRVAAFVRSLAFELPQSKVEPDVEDTESAEGM